MLPQERDHIQLHWSPPPTAATMGDSSEAPVSVIFTTQYLILV